MSDDLSPMTPRLKRVLEFAETEAASQGHNYIGTEHVLIALLAVGHGFAARRMVDAGMTVEGERAALKGEDK